MYIKKLRDLREDRDLTQKEVAAYLRITQQQYSLYENGKRTLPVDLLIQLSTLYGVSTDYILDIKNKNNSIKNQVNISGGKNKVNMN